MLSEFYNAMDTINLFIYTVLTQATSLTTKNIPAPSPLSSYRQTVTVVKADNSHLMVMILSVVESRDLSISTWAVEMSRMALMLQPPRPITRLIVFAGTNSRFDLHKAIHC